MPSASSAKDRVGSLHIVMSHTPLTTYLRMYRRRTGLSQEDVSYLLGVVCGTNVSRHEVGGRIPVLETALAYEIIFRASVRDLYEGDFRRIESLIRRRAEGLSAFLARKPKTAQRDQKIRFLQRLISAEGEKQAA